MEALIGLVGKDFVLVAADVLVARSIMVMKAGEDKTRKLNDNVVLAYSGEAGDTVAFAEYIQRNVQLYGIKNDLPLTTSAAAHYTRKELASALRSKHPYQVNLLLAGFNEKDGPELFWLDHLAALNKIPFAAHGYAAFFCMSLMDRYYHKDLTVEEGIDILKMCFAELKTRFIVNFPKFIIKIIDKNGTREVTV